MIYDYLDQISRYRGLHVNIDLAIDYLEKTDLTTLELGRHEVAGDKVFVFRQDNVLNDQATDNFEYHKRYMDLQFLLGGHEHFRYARKAEGEDKPFDDSSDIGFILSKEAYDLELTEGTFVMVFPGEFHQPSQMGRGDSLAQKVVVKILID